jgi:aryl-alcohol dehydrogenase-like predicted oxidoreductase
VLCARPLARAPGRVRGDAARRGRGLRAAAGSRGKVAARRDADGAPLRFDECLELREGIEDNLATLGADRLAAVNLRMMDPSETPGRQFDAQLAALVQAREEGLIGGIGLIPGTRTRVHLAENLGAADVRPDDAARAELTQRALGSSGLPTGKPVPPGPCLAPGS